MTKDKEAAALAAAVGGADHDNTLILAAEAAALLDDDNEHLAHAAFAPGLDVMNIPLALPGAPADEVGGNDEAAEEGAEDEVKWEEVRWEAALFKVDPKGVTWTTRRRCSC